jgi:two-component system chemotaxis response regulator CheY
MFLKDKESVMAKILVVDDSKFMRLTLINYIEKRSSGRHQVVGEAADDISAVAKYRELRPDAVTMDIIMPVESGLKAVKEIVSLDPKARIVMVSAMGQEKICEEAKELGAKGFITKPVKPEELLKELDRILSLPL